MTSQPRAEGRGAVRYEIALKGCDDVTRFAIDATPSEAAFMARLEELANEASEYSCMPRMEVWTNEGAAPTAEGRTP